EPRVSAEKAVRRDRPALCRDISERRRLALHMATSAVALFDAVLDACETRASERAPSPWRHVVRAGEELGVPGFFAEERAVAARAKLDALAERTGALPVDADALGVSGSGDGQRGVREDVAPVPVNGRFRD